MKRTMTAVCTTLVTGMMMITPAFAANTSTGHTDISLFVPNDPIYTVTVPEKVTLSATEHTQVLLLQVMYSISQKVRRSQLY